MSVQTIVARVQLFMADEKQDWCDADYVTRWLAVHNEDVESMLADLDLSFDTDVIVLSAVPAGTSDLSSYQQDGGQLDMMMIITALEWRLVGDDDSKWRPVGRKDKVEDLVQPVEGISSFEWRKGTVYISPSSVDVDLRVRCEDLPALVDSDSATYIKGMTNVLAYGVAEMISVSRGGPAAALGVYFANKFQSAFDSIADRMVKDEQSVPRRMAGRRSQSSGPIWRVPNL